MQLLVRPILMLIATGLLLSHAPRQAQSQQQGMFAAPPPPPEIGEPGQRSEAGSRPTNSCKQAAKPLTALVPAYRSTPDAEIVWGMTAIAQPSFWFYVPYSSAAARGEFVVESAIKQQTIFKVPLAAKAGMVQVQMAKQTMLQVGQPYRWYFNVYCRDRDEIDSYVEGSVTRKPLNSALKTQINRSNLQQRVALLAANGIWYDALTIASALRCQQTDDPNWPRLLQSVGLNQLTQEPIVNCSQATRLTHL